MRTIGFFCTLFTTVYAVCKGRTCWVPSSGDIVLDAVDALGVDFETFKKWNPEHPNLDEIHTTDIFAVSSVGPLKDAVWMTSDGTRFLSLVATSGPGYETLVGTGGRSSLTSEGPTTLRTTFTATPTLDPAASSSPSQVTSPGRTLSPSVNSPTSGLGQSTSPTHGKSTVTSRTSTASAEPAKPTPPCGGLVKGLPLLCNAKNDGTFFTNEKNLKSLIRDFCLEYAGGEVGDNTYTSLLDREKPSIRYQIYAVAMQECKATQLQAMPSIEDCNDRLYDIFKQCGCNGGTGGILLDKDTCVLLYYRPTSGKKVPFGVDPNWGLEYVDDFIEGKLQGPEISGVWDV